MSNFPAAARLVEQPSGKAAKLVLSRAKAYYSRAGQVRLTPDKITIDANTGLSTVVVAFPTPVKDTNFVVLGLTFMNVGDSLVDIVFLSAMPTVLQSQAGFTVLLSTAPPTDNYYMNWGIAEIHNP